VCDDCAIGATQTFTNETHTYDVRKLWELAPKAQWLRIETLLRNIDQNIWGEDELTPREILERKAGREWDVAMMSDLRYAIIVTPTMMIADGNHRLLKAIALGKTKIRARKFVSYDDMTPAICPDYNEVGNE